MAAQDKHPELAMVHMEDLEAVHQIMENAVGHQVEEDTQVEALRQIKILKAEAEVHILKVFIKMKFQKQFQAVTQVYQQTPAQMEMVLLN